MDFILQRYSDNRTSTLGVLLKKSQGPGGTTRVNLQAYTLEDEYRENKVSGETRIPAGTYKLGLQKSDTPMTLRYRAKYPTWFRHHIEVLNVPNFKGIYIHIGNGDDDTDGCILLGDSADNNSISAGMVTNSTQAFQRFYKEVYDDLAKGLNITLTIRDESNIK